MKGVNIRKLIMSKTEHETFERCAVILAQLHSDFANVLKVEELDEVGELEDILVDFENVCDELGRLISDIENCEYIDVQWD